MKTQKFLAVFTCLALIFSAMAFANTDRLGSSTISFNRTKYMAKSAAYTITTSDNGAEVGVTCSSANLAITLPSVASASASGTFRVKIKKVDATIYTVTATPATGDTIGFESTRVLNYQNAYMVLHTGPNNNWEVEYESPYINADYEAGTVSFYGLNTFTSDVSITGTTPALTIGDTGAEDTSLLFSGNTKSFYVGLDDSEDDLVIGVGIAVGTTPAIKVDENAAVTIGGAVTDELTIVSAIVGTNPFILDGATDNTNELTVALNADPGADYTLTVPATSSAAIMVSSLTTNDVDVANSIWGISNGIAFGGATGADGFELQLKPMGDPGADKSILFPVLTNASAMISTLTTNDVNVANSVWGVSNGIAFGGVSGADGFETTLTVADPGADYVATLPAATGTLSMISGVGSYATYSVATGNFVATSADCGKIFGFATDTTNVVTLPATISGCTFCFANMGAAGNNIIAISPNASDKIWGTTIGVHVGTVILGADDEDLINTKATANKGDIACLMGEGTDGWLITKATGTWAEASP